MSKKPKILEGINFIKIFQMSKFIVNDELETVN